MFGLATRRILLALLKMLLPFSDSIGYMEANLAFALAAHTGQDKPWLVS